MDQTSAANTVVSANPAPPVDPPGDRLPIELWPSPLLKTVSVPWTGTVEVPGVGLVNGEEFAKILFNTMYAAGGAGLAAIQVGIPVRALVVDVSPNGDKLEAKALFNPVIMIRDGKKTFTEGCLSVPGFMADIERNAKITVFYTDEFGVNQSLDAEGILADAIQHEIDHLDGITFVEKLSHLKRDMARRKVQKVKKYLKIRAKNDERISAEMIKRASSHA